MYTINVMKFHTPLLLAFMHMDISSFKVQAHSVYLLDIVCKSYGLCSDNIHMGSLQPLIFRGSVVKENKTKQQSPSWDKILVPVPSETIEHDQNPLRFLKNPKSHPFSTSKRYLNSLKDSSYLQIDQKV